MQPAVSPEAFNGRAPVGTRPLSQQVAVIDPLSQASSADICHDTGKTIPPADKLRHHHGQQFAIGPRQPKLELPGPRRRAHILGAETLAVLVKQGLDRLPCRIAFDICRPDEAPMRPALTFLYLVAALAFGLIQWLTR